MTARHLRHLAVATALLASALSACSDDGADVEAFCSAATDHNRFETVFDDLDPTDVPAALAAFREAQRTEQSLRDVAPGAVRGDIETVLAFIDDLIEGLERAGTDASRPEVYDQLRPRFDEVEAAGGRLDTYVATNC